MEWITCALCNSDSSILLKRVSDIKMKTRDAFCLVRCNRCGLVYMNPRPTVSEMQSYYDNTYSPHLAAHANASERLGSDDQYYSGRVRQFLGYLPQGFTTGRLLDVGCGDGYWLYLM
ncbi:MAG: hypothetical protein SWO11_06950 [Thermodesulfobacteriota bacterium]|nr:hypothetical protein [Thermodesulfobacteriota bacterium]